MAMRGRATSPAGEPRGLVAPRRAGPHFSLVLKAGAVLTAVACAADAFGAFRSLEHLSVDARFRYRPEEAAPLSDAIRFVEIDDATLDNWGRWPWDRRLLARAIDEIRRSGARTIALDILFLEPQREAAPSGDGNDPDETLAESLAGCRCVLALDVDPEALREDVWTESRGAQELQRLREVLRDQRFEISPEQAAAAARLTGPRLAAFLRSPYAILKELAQRQIEESPGGPASGDPGEVPPLLQRAFDQQHSSQAVGPLLLPPGPGAGGRLRAPLLALARQAASAGFVDYETGPDGGVQALAAILGTTQGRVLQFGLAAAATHLGVAPRDVTVNDGVLSLGSRSLPLLPDGKLLVAWPTTRGGWTRMDQQGSGEGLRRCSVGFFLQLDELRRRLEGFQAQYARELQKIKETLARDLGFDSLSDEARKEVDSQIQYVLESLPGEDERDAEDPAELAPYRWIQQGAEVIRERSARIARDHETAQEFLEDRLAFVGITATGSQDTASTPIDPRTPGVVVHGVLADMVLSGRGMRSPAGWWSTVLVAIMGLVLTLAAAQGRVRVSVLAALLLEASLVVLAFVSSQGGWMIPLGAPLSGGALVWIGCTTLDAGLSKRDRQRISRQFKARASPQLVDYLSRKPASFSMKGEQRVATVLFLDLAGFTSISELLGGPRTVTVLNRCMQLMTRILIDNEAYVNKFLGDGLLAFWSAFWDQPDQGRRACEAALACRGALDRLNLEPDFEDVPPISARLGIATGTVIIGDCGAPPDVVDYTAIGDAVNVASRLESANKHFGTRVLIDGKTREQIRESGLRVRSIGSIAIVGRTRPVDVYELVDASMPQRLMELTDRAVQAFRDGSLQESLGYWNQVEHEFGLSGLTARYRQAIENGEAREEGVLHLEEK